MAFNASKTPLIRAIAKRGYSAKAASNPCEVSLGGVPEIKSSVLNNKLVIASATSQLPVARVSFVFRAGSRFENYENLGAAHYMNLNAHLTTDEASQFMKKRQLNQIGSDIVGSNGRELVAYTVNFTADKAAVALKYLAAAVTSPTFKPWEIKDHSSYIRANRELRTPLDKAMEFAHAAAFRTGLGNSIYCPKHKIEKLYQDDLLQYFADHCTSQRSAVVGVGIDHAILEDFGKHLTLGQGEGPTSGSTYYGGDMRKDRGGSSTHVVIGGPGAGLCNEKEALAFSILKFAIGVQSGTKRGVTTGPLSATLGPIADYSAFSLPYADTGFFGIKMNVGGNDAGKAIDTAVKVLKSGSVSDADFKRAKAIVTFALTKSGESPSRLHKALLVKATITGEAPQTDALLKVVNSIQKSDVDAVAKKLASAKLSIGAYGNLKSVPYSADFK